MYSPPWVLTREIFFSLTKGVNGTGLSGHVHPNFECIANSPRQQQLELLSAQRSAPTSSMSSQYVPNIVLLSSPTSMTDQLGLCSVPSDCFVLCSVQLSTVSSCSVQSNINVLFSVQLSTMSFCSVYSSIMSSSVQSNIMSSLVSSPTVCPLHCPFQYYVLL